MSGASRERRRRARLEKRAEARAEARVLASQGPVPPREAPPAAPAPGWLRRTWGWIAALATAAAAFGPAGYGYFYGAPTIVAPRVDPAQPFALPFRITNDTWMDLGSVFPDCQIEFADLGWMQLGLTETQGLEAYGDMPAGSKKTYVCPFIIWEHYKALYVTLTVYYRLPLIPFVAWYPVKRTTEHRFHVAIISTGEREWVEGDDISGALGHPPVPARPKSSPLAEHRQRLAEGWLPPKPIISKHNAAVQFGRSKADVDAEDREAEKGTPPPQP